MDENCLDKVTVSIKQNNGKLKMVVYDVETLKNDIVNHVDGKILGLRREIFNEEDPKRVVRTNQPFKTTLKPEHDPMISPGVEPFHSYRRVQPALKPIFDAWVLDAAKAGMIQPYQSMSLTIRALCSWCENRRKTTLFGRSTW